MTLGRYRASSISKMFCRAKITWSLLLQASIYTVLKTYGIHKGVLSIDDTANKRSKKTSKIAKTHKTKDKSTGGYFNAQELVLMVLITDKVTLPVGFDFYEPQPEMSAWYKTYQQQKRQGIAKRLRAPKPAVDKQRYPTKTQIALSLIATFVRAFPQLKVQCIVADALYGNNVKKEYEDYLLNLTILVVDGLALKTLRELTGSDKNSLACLEQLLINWGSENTTFIMNGLRELQRQRSKYVGHGGGKMDFNIVEAYLAITDQINKAIQLLVDEIRVQSD